MYSVKNLPGVTDVDLDCDMGNTNIPPGGVALSKEEYWFNKKKEAQLHTCMFGMYQDEKDHTAS